MYLDYSNLPFDKDGNPEQPELVLQTLSGETICPIQGAYNIEFDINFSEPSEIEFDVPAVIDGFVNPAYDSVNGWCQVWTEYYGVYVILSPETEADGISEVKHCTGYSIEKMLEYKKFWMEEGTFKFWDASDPSDTILGRILEVAIGWSVGSVASGVANTYRTFDEYDEDLLSFIYNTAPEKYRCVFVFDPYEKTINVWDADEEYGCLPINLDFENLLSSVEVEELSDELVTAISPYGADDLDVRAVNPLGTNWLYDLSYFVSNGSISGELGEKYMEWQQAVVSASAGYEALSALRASCTAKLLTAQAEMTELENELSTLTIKQNAAISGGLADELSEITAEIAAKNSEISTQQKVIDALEEEEEGYANDLSEISSSLAIKSYFTDEEYQKLDPYIIEMYLTEETFVATDVDTSVSGNNYSLNGATISITDSNITYVNLEDYNKGVYSIAGGTFTVADSDGSYSVSGDIVRGTIEIDSDSSCVLSMYAGSMTTTINGTSADSDNGLVTINGRLTGNTNDVTEVTENEVTTNKGTTLTATTGSGSMYITADVNDYQQYAVAKELYDYAADVLSEYATPTYEFSVDSANFLFAQVFEPFRYRLEMGKGVYLNLGHGEIITPYIIEMQFGFEDKSKFELTFSNRFKRHDNVNTLKDMIESSYSTSRSIDASSYIYNKTTSQVETVVSKFLNDSLDFATNTILSSTNQSVIIDDSGITVRELAGENGDEPTSYELRITDGMIAFTDDYWQTSKLAIGHFLFNGNDYYGVSAEVLVGELLMGESLYITNEDKTFTMDENGLIVSSDTTGNSFTVNPTNDDAMVAIANSSGNVLWIDADGALHINISSNEMTLTDDSGVTQTLNSYFNVMQDEINSGVSETINETLSTGGYLTDADLSDYATTGDVDEAVAELQETLKDTIDEAVSTATITATEKASIQSAIDTLEAVKAQTDGEYAELLKNTNISDDVLTALKEAYKEAFGEDGNSGTYAALIAAAEAVANASEEELAYKSSEFNAAYDAFKEDLAAYSAAVAACLNGVATTILNSIATTDANVSKLQTQMSEANAAISDLHNEIDEAVADGMLSAEEASYIRAILAIVEKEKTDADSAYEELYNSSNLSAARKNKLASTYANAYGSSESAYAKLVAAVEALLSCEAVEGYEETLITSHSSETITTDSEEELIAYQTAMDYKEALAAAEADFEAAYAAFMVASANYESAVAACSINSLEETVGALNSQLNDVEDAMDTLDADLREAISDGVMTSKEFSRLKARLDVLEKEKADADAEYEIVIATNGLDETLEGNLKTAYGTAYGNSDSKYAKLVAAINAVLYEEDGETRQEKVDDDEVTAYENALSEFNSASAAYREAVAACSTGSIDSLISAIETQASEFNDALETTATTLNTAISDGVLTSSEIARVKAVLDAMEKEAGDVAEEYAVLYADEAGLLTDVQKKDLKSLYEDAYVTAYNTLVSAINDVLYDSNGKERTTVDKDAVKEYQAALTAFCEATSAYNAYVISLNSDSLAAWVGSLEAQLSDVQNVTDKLDATIDAAIADKQLDMTEISHIVAVRDMLVKEKGDADEAYSELLSNTSIGSTAKTNLETAYKAAYGDGKAYDTLIAAIDEIIYTEDGSYQTEVDNTEVEAYKAALEAFYTASAAYSAAVAACLNGVATTFDDALDGLWEDIEKALTDGNLSDAEITVILRTMDTIRWTVDSNKDEDDVIYANALGLSSLTDEQKAKIISAYYALYGSSGAYAELIAALDAVNACEAVDGYEEQLLETQYTGTEDDEAIKDSLIATDSGEDLFAYRTEISYADAFLAASDAVEGALSRYGTLRGQFSAVIANINTAILESSIDTLTGNFEALTDSIYGDSEITSLDEVIQAAIADGTITAGEKQAIEEALKALAAQYEELKAGYDQVYDSLKIIVTSYNTSNNTSGETDESEDSEVSIQVAQFADDDFDDFEKLWKAYEDAYDDLVTAANNVMNQTTQAGINKYMELYNAAYATLYNATAAYAAKLQYLLFGVDVAINTGLSSAVTQTNTLISSEVSRATAAETDLAFKTYHYATCTTEAGTATKVAFCEGFTLYVGATLSVYFTNCNTANNPKLIVKYIDDDKESLLKLTTSQLMNGAYQEIQTDDGEDIVVGTTVSTSAVPIYAYGEPITSSSSYNWAANSIVNLIYNGEYWGVVDSSSLSRIQQTADSITAMVSRSQETVAGKYGTCSTAAATAAKVVKCSNFTLYAGETIAVKFTYANEADQPTMNVNGSGAKPIYAYGSRLSTDESDANSCYNWEAGAIVTFLYDGAYWQLVNDNGAISIINQTADEISSTVSDLQTSVSNIVQQSNSIQSTVIGSAAHIGTCSTAAATGAKVVSCSTFPTTITVLDESDSSSSTETITAPSAGMSISVTFTNGSSAFKTLQITNGSLKTDAITIGSSANCEKGDILTFIYDGSKWQLSDTAAYSQITQLADSISLCVTHENGDGYADASSILSAASDDAGGQIAEYSLSLVSGLGDANKDEDASAGYAAAAIQAAAESSASKALSTYMMSVTSELGTETDGSAEKAAAAIKATADASADSAIGSIELSTSVDGNTVALTLKSTGNSGTANLVTETFTVSSNGMLCVLYSKSNSSTPTSSTWSSATASSTTWHKNFYTTDYYASYSYDYGDTWTAPVKIQAKDGADGTDGSDAEIPGYIEETCITSTTIFSPYIFGGMFFATGRGSNYNPDVDWDDKSNSDRVGEAAYYIYDGCDVADDGTYKLGTQIGYLSYDTDGDGTDESAEKRVFLTTLGDVVLKLNSAANMSIEAGKTIFIGSDTMLTSSVRFGTASYGTSTDDVSDPQEGQIFFVISS